MTRRSRSRRNGRVAAVLLLGLGTLATGALAAGETESKRVEIDRCIAGKCKYGRFDSITVTPEQFLIRIQPNWCENSGYHCSVSYGRFTADDAAGPDLRVTSYEVGTKTSTMFVVYVPRHSNALYIHNVNGTDRDAVLDLRPFQKYVHPVDPYGGLSTGASARTARTSADSTAPAPPPATPPVTGREREATGEPETAAGMPAAAPATPDDLPAVRGSGGRAGDTLRIDALFDRFAEAYRTLDADTLAGLYTDDAIYLAPQGDLIRGREAIAARFRAMFERAAASGQRLEIEFTTVERSIEGSTAYEVGYYRLERHGGQPDRGKFSLVLRRDGDDWRVHVDSYSPAPLQ